MTENEGRDSREVNNSTDIFMENKTVEVVTIATYKALISVLDALEIKEAKKRDLALKIYADTFSKELEEANR